MAFFKRTTSLFDTQLDQLAGKVVSAAELLRDLLANPGEAQRRAHDIGELEHAADRIVRETITLQAASLAAPERGDLLGLLERLDDIVDTSDAAAQRVWLHQVGEATPEARQLAEVLVESARVVRQIVNALRDMNQVHTILDLCMELTRLENKGDEVYRSAMLSLFDGKHDALHVVRWKDVYERMENGINKCQDVANLVEGLVQAIA